MIKVVKRAKILSLPGRPLLKYIVDDDNRPVFLNKTDIARFLGISHNYISGTPEILYLNTTGNTCHGMAYSVVAVRGLAQRFDKDIRDLDEWIARREWDTTEKQEPVKTEAPEKSGTDEPSMYTIVPAMLKTMQETCTEAAQALQNGDTQSAIAKISIQQALLAIVRQYGILETIGG